MSLRRKPASTATLIPRTSTNSGFALTSSGAVGFAEDAHTEHNLSSTGMSALGLHQQIQSLQSKVRDLEKGSSTQSKTESMQKTTVMNNRDAFQKISASSWPKAAEVSLGHIFQPDAVSRMQLLEATKRTRRTVMTTDKNLKENTSPMLTIMDFITNYWKAAPYPVTQQFDQEWKGRNHLSLHEVHKLVPRTNKTETLVRGCNETKGIYDVHESVLGKEIQEIYKKLETFGNFESVLKVHQAKVAAEDAIIALELVYEKHVSLRRATHSKMYRCLVYAKSHFKEKYPTEEDLAKMEKELEVLSIKNRNNNHADVPENVYMTLNDNVKVSIFSAQIMTGMFEVYYAYNKIVDTCKTYETMCKSAFEKAVSFPQESDVVMDDKPINGLKKKTDVPSRSQFFLGHKWHNDQYAHPDSRGHKSSRGKHYHEDDDAQKRKKHNDPRQREEESVFGSSAFCECEHPVPMTMRRVREMPTAKIQQQRSFCQCDNPVPMRIKTNSNFCQCAEPIPIQTSTIVSEQAKARRRKSKKHASVKAKPHTRSHGSFVSHGPHTRRRPGGYYLRPRHPFSEEITDGAGPLFQSHDFDEYYY
jgi:hypothetical protein